MFKVVVKSKPIARAKPKAKPKAKSKAKPKPKPKPKVKSWQKFTPEQIAYLERLRAWGESFR